MTNFSETGCTVSKDIEGDGISILGAGTTTEVTYDVDTVYQVLTVNSSGITTSLNSCDKSYLVNDSYVFVYGSVKDNGEFFASRMIVVEVS